MKIISENARNKHYMPKKQGTKSVQNRHNG